MAEVSVRSEETIYFPAGNVVKEGAVAVDVRMGTGLGLKIFSAAQPQVQSLFVFLVNIFVTFSSGDYQDLPEAGLHQQQPRALQHLKSNH